MKKEFEKKVALPKEEFVIDDSIDEVEINGVKCLRQSNIPMEDWFDIYTKCVDEYLNGDFVEPAVIMCKVILDNYTNINTEGMSAREISDTYDIVDNGFDIWTPVRERLELFMIGNEVYNNTASALKEFFNEDVSVNLVEQLKEDISSFDAEKLKELTNLFIETKIK